MQSIVGRIKTTSLTCRVDGILDLSHPVDVYSDWVDACDAVAKKGGEQVGSERTVAAARASGRGAGVNEDGNLDDLIDDGGVERDRSQEAMVGDDEDDDY